MNYGQNSSCAFCFGVVAVSEADNSKSQLLKPSVPAELDTDIGDKKDNMFLCDVGQLML